MAHSPADVNDEGLEFLTVRHLATLTTLLPDGRPHVVPVGFTVDFPQDGGSALARVITSGTSQKAHNAARDGRVAIGQVDGGRWITVEGTATVSDDPERVAEAVARYAVRYRQPRVNPRRVVVEIRIDRLLGSSAFFGELPEESA